MSRALVRRVSVMIVMVAIAFVALPVADARPLAGSHSTVGATPSWVAALSTWVSSFLPGTPAKTAAPAIRWMSAAELSSSKSGSIIMTGTCIDPNGHPVPCGQM